ncbi:MAG: type I DNA topoisomerase [Spirochaetales bacterium]|nr:type I DNA topoisomerase [Spirochaetales bacterium]
MSKGFTLVIVESPAKAKTIEKYLGSGYHVTASMGHLIDLPKSRLAIDVDHGFNPEYITVRGKAKILKEIKSKSLRANLVLLASDNDREGEAIAYHIYRTLEKAKKDIEIKRIIFNEITPDAIRKAVDNPIELDYKKVDSQKARRVLDRLVGYNLSPLLWKKVKNGLSAGRVQSVALKLICDREEEVESFIPEEYWTLEASLNNGTAKNFIAKLASYGDSKVNFHNEEEVTAVKNELADADFVVAERKETKKVSKPKPPFTTSTLQQVAANKLGFNSKKTMQIAQQLYEGIEIGASRVGLISYMRTDSVRVSNQALEDVRKFISDSFPKFLPDEANQYSVAKRSQDAHEAIRPTYVANYTPEYLKGFLNKDQLRLYTIIWERFVSSQMSNSVSKIISYSIKAKSAIFKCSSTVLEQKGYQAVLKLLKAKSGEANAPALKEGDILTLQELLADQHFTQGPARFTDASIVKALEENGIGRPSTYAPIISVLLDRYYVVRKNKQLQPTVLGKLISNMLSEQFPDLLNVKFTASLEQQLDDVEEGKLDWHKMLGDFYSPFSQQVDHVNETMESIKGVLDEESDEVCEKCGKPMVKKLGRFGYFLACSGFPECLNTKSVPLAKCPRPNCDGDIVARKKQGGKGKEFYGCTNYPECDFITHFKPSESKCPKCGQFLVEKNDKKFGIDKACINPDCDFLHIAGEDDEQV